MRLWIAIALSLLGLVGAGTIALAFGILASIVASGSINSARPLAEMEFVSVLAAILWMFVGLIPLLHLGLLGFLDWRQKQLPRWLYLLTKIVFVVGAIAACISLPVVVGARRTEPWLFSVVVPPVLYVGGLGGHFLFRKIRQVT